MDSSAARKLPDVRSDSLGWSEWKVISENLHLTHLAYRSKLHLRVEAEAKVAIQPIKHAKNMKIIIKKILSHSRDGAADLKIIQSELTD